MYWNPRLSRRSILKGALAAGAAWVAASLRPLSAWSDEPILTRAIPSLKERLPAVGLGTWKTFDVGESKDERAPLREVLRLFHEAGGRVVDTSPMYGRAEQVVGDLARELGIGDDLFLATKVWTRGRDEGMQQMAASEEKLQASIDLMQIHNLLDWKTHLETLRLWKNGGRLRYSGVTHYSVDAHARLAEVLRSEALDFVQVNYSLLTRDAEKTVFPAAQERGVAVIVNQPFESGDLFRRVDGKPLPAWAADIGCEAWSQVFLKFVLSHPAVTCVIPATSKPSHLRENMAAARGPLPDAALRQRMVKDILGA